MDSKNTDYEKDDLMNNELTTFSEKLVSISQRYNEINSKSRKHLINADSSINYLISNMKNIKIMIDKHDRISKHCLECIEHIQFFFGSMKNLKSCQEKIQKIALDINTVENYLQIVKTIDYYLKYFNENSPIFPDVKDWEILHQETHNILTGYINNFIEQDLEININYIYDLADSWVISGLRPLQDEFIKTRTENLLNPVLDKIVKFMRDNGKYNTNDEQFTTKRKFFYENLISYYNRMNFSLSNDDRKSSRSLNSLIDKRKSMKRTVSIRICDNFFQINNFESKTDHISEDFTILSKMFALSLLILKMDIYAIEKVYSENASEDIISKLLIIFWNMISEIMENAIIYINKTIKLYTLDGCLKVMEKILPVIGFFFDNQDQALILSKHGNHEKIQIYIMDLTKPIEKLYFETFKSFDDQLKDKSLHDFLKTNESGIDEKIVIIKDFISYLHMYANIIGYICAKNKIQLEFSNFENSHYTHLRLFTDPMIAKYISFPLSGMKNVSYPKREIYLINQCRYILESIDFGILKDFTLQNTIAFYQKQLNEIMDSSKLQYMKYWEKGIELLKSNYDKFQDSFEKNSSYLIDLKSKDKALIKNAFSDFKDFIKQVPEDHENIKFYNKSDALYFKEKINEKIITPYAVYCEAFLILSKKKKTSEHIKITSPDILILIDSIFG